MAFLKPALPNFWATKRILQPKWGTYSQGQSHFLACLAFIFLVFGLELQAIRADEPLLLARSLVYDNGKPKERYTYVLNAEGIETRQGESKEWAPSGELKGLRNFKNGLQDGPVIYYYSLGRKSYEANYKAGKRTGFATAWYSNGQKKWEATFIEGKIHGIWREWYENGKKKYQAQYHQGLLEGMVNWWFPSGSPQQERKFQEGKLVEGSVKAWNENGRQTWPPIQDVFANDESDKVPPNPEFQKEKP